MISLSRERFSGFAFKISCGIPDVVKSSDKNSDFSTFDVPIKIG
jgi:hypothetical protein